MSAEQALQDGKLDQALAELQQQVRRNPSDPKSRVFLFQLFCVQGQWERALVQLNTAAELDAAALGMAQMYREALHCEAVRGDVFAGKLSPTVFGEPPPWIGLMVEALRLTAQGRHDAAQPLRDQALADAPATAGTIDGHSFQWLADVDSRLGPVVEAVIAGRYFWVPVERIQRMTIEAPADLRDLVWMPAHFTWSNGGEMVGLIPTRYPGSERSDDPLIRLARKTAWTEPAPGVVLGTGQRMWATDQDDFPLMDTRQVELGQNGQG